MFRVFTEDVEMPVAVEEKSDEEIQAMGFAKEEIRKHFLAWNILSRAIKGKADNDIYIAPSYLANCYYERCKTTTHESAYEQTCEIWLQSNSHPFRNGR